MQKYRLKNGSTLILDRNSSKTVAVEIMFKVGSNFENGKQAGLAHFLEHMVFEGTKNRRDSREIANEIEKYGGEFNAYTTGERTAFFIKIINKRFEVALDILSDMLKNSIFDKKIMEKEKQVVLKEINMVTDDPRSHQWVLFQKNVFEKHPAKNPTYGTVNAVKNFSRSQLFDYFKKHYHAGSMIISVVGNVNNAKEKVEKYFGDVPSKKRFRRLKVIEPKSHQKKFTEKRKTLNSYLVLGYKIVHRKHPDSYVFDVINGILGRGQSGWMFNEIRNKRGLAYQVGTNTDMDTDYGIFAVYTGLEKKNLEKAKGLIKENLTRLQTATKKDIEESKTFIEGNFTMDTEDNFKRADNLAFWESIQDAKLSDIYLKRIKKISVNDVKRVAKKYFNENYTMVTIEPK